MATDHSLPFGTAAAAISTAGIIKST